jgi:ABC-type uncharacterized transport system permease subunit
MPTPAQSILLTLALALWLAGGMISFFRRPQPGVVKWQLLRWCAAGGILCALGVIVLHASGRGDWIPINDNFEALIGLAVLLAAFVMYVQSTRPIIGLDWFLMPVAIVLLAAAGVFGRLEYRQYQALARAWYGVHRVSCYAGTAFFAIAAAGGAMYMSASRRLHLKQPTPMTGSLERLEHIMMTGVTLGFALLTVGLITGLAAMFDGSARGQWPILLPACGAWLVYAVVMHAPINPRLRGRRAAFLSVVGFALVIGALVAVLFLAGRRG